MKKVIDLVRYAAHYLEKKLIASPDREAEILSCLAFNLTPTQLYMDSYRSIDNLDCIRLISFLERRAKGEPWQYIAGRIDFFGADISLNRSVLIPRQETEILVNHIVDEIPSNFSGEIWDLATGSGCIAIALKKKYPSCRLVASDISSAALSVAQHNAFLNNVSIEFLEGDFLTPFRGRSAQIVISNPPYISEEEYKELDREVREWEPFEALVAGTNKFLWYERLAMELPSFIAKEGRVYLEIGSGMGSYINQLFDNRLWRERKMINDWAGHNRYFFVYT